MQKLPIIQKTLEILKNGASLYRVRDWIKNLGIATIGLFISGQLSFNMFFIILAHISFLFAYTFSINDFYDFKLMKELNYISKKVKKGTSEKKLLVFTLLPLFGTLITSALLSPVSLALSFLFILLFSFYSCPPLRLKRHWLFSLSINMICIGALSFLIAYFSMINIISYKALMFVLIFSSYIFSTELIHQISHRKKDKKAGIKSFPGVYGIRNSLGFFQIVQLIVIASSLYLLYSNFYLNVIFFGTILFSLLRILKVKNLNIKEADFEKMRDHMYGLYEGVYYLLCLSLF